MARPFPPPPLLMTRPLKEEFFCGFPNLIIKKIKEKKKMFLIANWSIKNIANQ